MHVNKEEWLNFINEEEEEQHVQWRRIFINQWLFYTDNPIKSNLIIVKITQTLLIITIIKNR